MSQTEKELTLGHFILSRGRISTLFTISEGAGSMI